MNDAIWVIFRGNSISTDIDIVFDKYIINFNLRHSNANVYHPKIQIAGSSYLIFVFSCKNSIPVTYTVGKQLNINIYTLRIN